MANLESFIRPERPPKFFSIDIDRTFYVDDEDKFESNKHSLTLLRSKGIVPFFCTSRCYRSAMVLLGDKFVADTGYNGFPGVYGNGCVVFDESGKILFMKKFTKEFLDKYVKFVKDNKLEDRTLFETAYTSYILEAPNPKITRNIEIKNMHEPELSTLDIVYSSDIISVRHINNGMEIPDLVRDKDYVCYVYGNVVTLNPAGVCKDIGIVKLLEHFNATPSDCAYIGDSKNDIPGMDLCDLSFAVGNADEAVKSHAKWTVDLDYDQGAFAKVVDAVYGF